MVFKPRLIKMRRGWLGNGLKDLIAYVNKIAPTKELTMVEIGAYSGESTSIFCDHFKSVTTIDPFVNDYDKGDKASSAAPMSKVQAVFNRRMQKYNNYTLIQKTSDEAFHDLESQQFDMVYIDGMHTYEQVKRDILNYRNLIKTGGFVTGHDYYQGWPNVVKAIEECYVKPHQVFGDSSWLVRKGICTLVQS
jgi:predicted O-methyltransferase YrrM